MLVIGSSQSARRIAKRLGVPFTAPGEPVSGGDVVLVAVSPVEPGVPITEMSEGDWAANCEAPLLDTRRALRTLSLAPPVAGRSVLVAVERQDVPDGSSIAGETVFEGVRALVLSAAEDWRTKGMTANFVAVMPPMADQAAAIGVLAESLGPGVTGQSVSLDSAA